MITLENWEFSNEQNGQSWENVTFLHLNLTVANSTTKNAEVSETCEENKTKSINF